MNPKPLHQAPGARPVFLVVEDDPAFQELTRRALVGHNGRSPDLRMVRDGEEALDYLRRTGPYADPAASPRPHLVLLDLNLPRLSGLEVLREIRSDPQVGTLPVIVLSVSDDERDVRASYGAKATSFITKPTGAKNYAQALRMVDDYWCGTVTLPAS